MALTIFGSALLVYGIALHIVPWLTKGVADDTSLNLMCIWSSILILAGVVALK